MMADHRSAKSILTVTLLALVVPGVILCCDGCAKKEEATPESTAEVQPEPVEQEQPGAEGAAQPAGDKQIVSTGDKVSIQYRGTLDDGTVFDQSSPGRPIVFVAGMGRVIPGFDNAVVGMKLNEEKTVTIPAAEAYGPSNPNMIRNLPRSSFTEGFQGQIGDDVTITNQAGQTLNGKVAGVSPDSLLIDFNHPLAGKDLTFDIKVVAIE